MFCFGFGFYPELLCLNSERPFRFPPPHNPKRIKKNKKEQNKIKKPRNRKKVKRTNKNYRVVNAGSGAVDVTVVEFGVPLVEPR